MAKKKTTIADLAAMVQKGFSETARQDEVSNRFGKIEKRLDKLEYNLKSDFNLRVEKLENDVAYIKNILAIN